MTCAQLVREELASGQKRLGSELERVGNRLTRTAAQLESAVAQMRGIGSKLEGDPSALRALQRSAAAESAAAREAAEIRAQLGIDGAPDQLPPANDVTLVTAQSPVQIVQPAAPESETGGAPTARGKPTPEERRKDLRLVRSEDLEGGVDLFLQQGRGPAATLPSPLQQTVPGWALFAMFFIVVPLAQSLHRERADGATRRILTMAVPRGAIVLGKILPFVLVGMAQFAGMLAVGLFVVPELGDLTLELGAKPLVLLPITAVCAWAATAYALLVATWTRTAERAAAFGATSVVILSVIGGVMVPHFLMPVTLQKIAIISPLYWGQKAYLDAFLHGAGIREVATPLMVLAGFAVVCMLLSVRRVAR